MEIGALIQLIAQSGGLLGLAIFSIWMLNKTHTQRAEELKQAVEDERARTAATSERERTDRAELIAVVNRNTDAWIGQTKSELATAEVMDRLCQTVDGNRQMIQDIRMIMAEHPCTAPAISAEAKKARESKRSAL